MPKILIVEDNCQLRENVETWLAREKYIVEAVGDGTEAMSRLAFYQYDAIVLDWQLPGLSGIDILRRLRSQGSNIVVLMLTAKNQINEIEEGLGTGADDYLKKPFQMRELSARLSGLLRRTAPSLRGNVLQVKDLVLDPTCHEVKRDGQPVLLTRVEFELLHLFMRHPKQVFSVSAIIERLWPSDAEVSEGGVRTHLNRLRGKLESCDSKYLKNAHGSGYYLDSD